MEKGQNIVRIHRPELTPEERAHRLEAIRKAAANLVKATTAAKQGKEASV